MISPAVLEGLKEAEALDSRLAGAENRSMSTRILLLGGGCGAASRDTKIVRRRTLGIILEVSHAKKSYIGAPSMYPTLGGCSMPVFKGITFEGKKDQLVQQFVSCSVAFGLWGSENNGPSS